MSLPTLIGKDYVTVFHNGVTHTVNSTDVNYAALRAAIRDGNWDEVPNLLTPVVSVETFGKGVITVKNGEVLYDGKVLHNSVTQRILDLIQEGFDAQPLMNFLTKLMQNPSFAAVNELYDWLERTSLPICEDGDFMAYKKVRSDYLDFFTRQIPNKPVAAMTAEERAKYPITVNDVTVEIEDDVTVVSMPRNKVDDNRNATCSYGLHFCSLSYLPNYMGGQGRVLLVKVNPTNVVSIPTDYNFAKGRAWSYTIVGEHTSEKEEAFDVPVVSAKVRGPVRKATPMKAAAPKPITSVLGVEFGDETRAAMVQTLVDGCYGGTITNLDDRQGKIDGFNDAWDRRPINLNRFRGNNIRTAVEYARGYFEGYDRLNKPVAAAATATPSIKAAPVLKATVAPTRKRNPALVGYNKGRSDAANARRCNSLAPAEFNVADAQIYASAYIKGYNSID